MQKKNEDDTLTGGHRSPNTSGCTEANFFKLHLNSFGDSRWETFIQK